jgi:hypothetical protein
MRPGTVTTGWDTEPVNHDFTLQEPFRSKGLLWARALRRRTIDYWYATTEDADAAAIEAALATVVLNVIDETVFEKCHGNTYQEHRRAHPQGRVVMGLELIRNCEVHAVELAQPTVAAMFGVPELGCRQVYTWAEFESLPVEYRQQQDGEPRARGEARDAYHKWIAGRPIIETLLDAIAFFESLDEALRPAEALDLRYTFVPGVPLGRNEEQLACRPMGLDQFHLFLPDLACRPTERRSASWEPADRWLKEQVKAIQKEQPSGVSREIRSRIIDEAGTFIGYQGLSGPRDAENRDFWVERAKQVGRDIRLGFKYFVVVKDIEVDATADTQLAVTAMSDSVDTLTELERSDSPISLDHLKLNEANPDLYRMERLAR